MHVDTYCFRGIIYTYTNTIYTLYNLVKFGTYLSDLPLAPSLHSNAAHLHHGFRELKVEPQAEQSPDSPGVILHDLLRRRVLPQPLVRFKHALPGLHVLEVAHIKLRHAARVKGDALGCVAVGRA